MNFFRRLGRTAAVIRRYRQGWPWLVLIRATVTDAALARDFFQLFPAHIRHRLKEAKTAAYWLEKLYRTLDRDIGPSLAKMALIEISLIWIS